MRPMPIVDVTTTASTNLPSSMATVLMVHPTITQLDHRSIELADHTHFTYIYLFDKGWKFVGRIAQERR
jgi:hypothetical protein